ncbi:LOW QUALITY PROTEIN: glutathione hydrolase 1 proenzyme-like [Pomacea canaliculata]|uniref:LOW QUALITY PROTEIN: glutathione hydrolase 1 proenzyme-like n=1 Tax=Pomacea canaliculata TaxID=400727 RepID=UPI000D730F6C|nr:LOW QUALITY PROTEIN: glutathione hydrolase 1 proenzyme-like [Pomacea canaliculata]
MSSGYDTEKGRPARSSSRAIVFAVLGAAVIIGIGLAIGLGVGLRSRDDKTCETPITSEQSQTFKSGHGEYRFASVAADSALCSKIGTEIMGRKGGNAADAAIAAAICAGLMSAHSSGIGGGVFIVFYNRTSGQAITINARETAPAAASQDMFVNNPSLSTYGGLAIGVPGELKGLWRLHQDHGRIPWRDLLTPTIDLCRQGAPLSKAQYDAAVQKKSELVNNPEFREKLAHTLQIIADEGADAFYNGTLSQMIVDDIRDSNGTITREDLADYTVDVTSPVTFNVTSSGLTVYSMPLPGSGVVLGYIFNILSGYGFTPDSMSTTDKAVLTYHRIVEAMKFAYAKRSELGDPKFLNISQLVHNMTSPEVGQEIRAKISDDKTHDIPYYEPSFFNKNDKGTSHTSVFDGEGNAVAITSTVNLYFGSKMKGNRTGIIFNNEMDDFSTPNTTNAFDVPASPANFIQPGKRPLSSMTPSVFVDSKTGEVKLVAGASGGTKITTATALVAMRTLWFNDSLVEAVDDPRVHHQLFPPEIHVDPGFPKDIQDGLVAKGHKVVAQSGSVVQAILNEDERLYAVSDWRKGGAPDGY